MSVRLPSLKTVAIVLAGLILAWLLLGWLALPRILQSQAQSYIADKTGHRLSLERPEFNPFTLRLRIPKLRLDQPDGQPLLSFDALTVDLSAASVLRRAIVVDAIELDAPLATVVLQADGSLNWSAVLAALSGPPQKSDSTDLPRFALGSLALAGGRIDFTDHRSAYSTRIAPLELTLRDITTLSEQSGSYRVSARTSDGARLQWQGQASLGPMALTGELSLAEVNLSGLAPYFKNALPAAPPTGMLDASATYRLAYSDGRLALTLDKIAAALKGLKLDTTQVAGPIVSVKSVQASGGRFDLASRTFSLTELRLSESDIDMPRAGAAPLRLLQLGTLTLADARVDLAGHSLDLARASLTGGQLKLARDAKGRIDAVEALQAVVAPKGKPAPAAAWRYRLGQLELAEFSARLQDSTVSPAANIAIDQFKLLVEGISDKQATPLPLRTSFRAAGGGTFEAAGQIVLAGPSADLKLKFSDLALKPAEPYLASLTKLQLQSGKVSTEGRATYDKAGFTYKGGFDLRDLRLVETETRQVFLAWKSLASKDLSLSTATLAIGDLLLDGLDTRLIIAKDKSVNVTHILRESNAPPGTPGSGAKTQTRTAATSATKAAPSTPAASPSFAVRIDRLRLTDGKLDFADNSLALPFAARIHKLRGAVSGLSSRPGGRAQVVLDGQVDEFGLARANGQIDLFHPAEFTDLKVVFRNIEMTRLTPYSATFAGRKINSGKLSLDLEYKINQRQLSGDNKILLEQLVLGERVQSASAMDLPLDLAIAVLEDSDGRIDLALPVSGSLDDPQFSYGGLIWKAIVNVIGKIVTAPFRALASLFGGDEKTEGMAFEAGDAQLTPPEREKLTRLAANLAKRPKLSLTVHGVYGEQDTAALQDLQLRRALMQRAGQTLKSDEDPGPLSTRTPKVQEALESLFGERLGAPALTALKDAFRKANPGVAEKDSEFHAGLYEHLRATEAVTEPQLQALAAARADHVLTALQAAGVQTQRLQRGATEKSTAAGRDVPLKMVMGASPK
ncbi:MAG: DUF748 domain-containing protein [Burkholderiaceae bacterium]|nr:DUF748 domain-containing protein [Burkholderiaceae bacterium]MDP1968641.1 DUF748 domain-containing protein [Burkholderiaceae bacterium]